MDDIPDTVIDTKTHFYWGGSEGKILIDNLIPNCDRCFVMSGRHMETHEPGFYAFCKKTENIDSVGPYRTYYEALKVLALTKGCVRCPFNRSLFKDVYLSFLDEKVKEQMGEIYGNDQSVKLLIDSLNNFAAAKCYLDINFESRFGFKLFLPLVEDSVATLNLLKPSSSSTDFAVKLQLLANMIRIDQNELMKRIKSSDKNDLQGSLLILERFLNENLPDYPSGAISTLRSLMALRNIFPAHVTTSKIITDLKVFGIDGYPLKNWDKGISTIVTICADSLDKITNRLRKK
jgi:hypothetical protein